MIDLIKKAMFTGIGFAVLTKDKIEEVAEEFVEQGKMSEQEGKKLVEEILARSEESQQDFTSRVEDIFQTGLEKMKLARMSDVDSLKTELAELKKKLHEQEKQKK